MKTGSAADKAGLHGFHASEVPYIFGTADRTPPLWPKVPAAAAETFLSDAMLDYWTSFARSGRPEAAGMPAWRPFGSDGAFMHFADRPRADKPHRPGMFALHENMVRRRRAAGDVPWNWNVGVAAPALPSAPEIRLDRRNRQDP